LLVVLRKQANQPMLYSHNVQLYSIERQRRLENISYNYVFMYTQYVMRYFHDNVFWFEVVNSSLNFITFGFSINFKEVGKYKLQLCIYHVYIHNMYWDIFMMMYFNNVMHIKEKDEVNWTLS
jgi:hypothetical protein